MSLPLVLYLLLAVGVACLVLLVVLLVRTGRNPAFALDRLLREESRAAREEQAAAARGLRDELAQAGKGSADTVIKLLGEQRESVHQTLARLGAQQQEQLEGMTRRLAELADAHRQASDRQLEALAEHLTRLQDGNEKKLEEMRVTVDEKLHGTLEKRLGESFALVSERLEAVQRGLGEMQSLANGVGDLRRVLTNVKTRGVWGEYQLQAILEEMLTPDQYVANYKPHDDGNDAVEFAIRLPGREAAGRPVYLPLDSKFPQEDYQRLLDAAERADADGVQVATAALIRAVRNSAQTICDKYVNPPATTDFAIMFLPTEGLYAEVLRQPGLVQEIQARCHIAVAGPTTLSAVLSSLRMGFRTLALERRSSEVWEVLGAVKSEFGKFGKVMATVKKQLNTVGNTIEETSRRTRAMERCLRDVEQLPPDAALAVLGVAGAGVLGDGDGDGIGDGGLDEEEAG